MEPWIKKIFLFSIIILTIIYTAFSSVSSKEKMRTAVIDFRAKGISKTIASAISELIRTEMINTGKYLIIERSQMNAIMQEQGFQQTGCTDVDCAVKIGKLLSARKMLVGTVSKIGQKIIISGRIIDIEKGIGEFGESVSMKSIDDLETSVKRFTTNLSLRIEGKKPLEKERPETVYKTGDIRTIGGIEFIYISGGKFFMGSESGEGKKYEHPQHIVQLDSFWIGKHEITQKQYKKLMRKNPSYFKGNDKPVERVSWDNAREFCKRFNKRYGKKFNLKARLPYEAEWEYASRAGTATKYYWGNDFANGEYCWYNMNSKDTTHAVGKKKANIWGLFDTSGNVWEWCMDWYQGSYYRNSPLRNPTGPDSGKYRIIRGGSFNNHFSFMRSAHRFTKIKNYRSMFYIGFRIALVPNNK